MADNFADVNAGSSPVNPMTLGQGVPDGYVIDSQSQTPEGYQLAGAPAKETQTPPQDGTPAKDATPKPQVTKEMVDDLDEPRIPRRRLNEVLERVKFVETAAQEAMREKEELKYALSTLQAERTRQAAPKPPDPSDFEEVSDYNMAVIAWKLDQQTQKTEQLMQHIQTQEQTRNEQARYERVYGEMHQEMDSLFGNQPELKTVPPAEQQRLKAEIWDIAREYGGIPFAKAYTLTDFAKKAEVKAEVQRQIALLHSKQNSSGSITPSNGPTTPQQGQGFNAAFEAAWNKHGGGT